MNSGCYRFLTAVIFSLLAVISAEGRDIPVPPPVTEKPEAPAYKVPSIEKLGNGQYRIGEILINKNDRSVTFPALVNMDNGMLEYLLVYRHGKTHESLLKTNISPYNLQIAFMLLNYEGTDKQLAGQGSPEIPKGEAVQITVSNVAGKSSEPFQVENWLINRVGETKKDIEPLNWVFTGSIVTERGAFLSQETGSIIAIWHDPVAMFDNASPGGESNRIWFVKQGGVPPVGTALNVTIKAVKK